MTPRCLIAIAPLLLGGCIPQPDPVDRAQTVVVATVFPPQSLDPAQGAAGTDLPILDQIYEQLVRFEPGSADAQLVGELAESWRVSEDGLRIDMQLRADRRFADGTAVTAQDAAWSLERVKRLGLGSAYFLDWLESAQATGRLTLRLTLKRPYALAPQMLAHPATSIVNRRAVMTESGPDDADGQRWLAQHSAGSGPYQLAAIRAGDGADLVANPNAAATPDRFTKVRFVAIPDEGVRRLLLERGDIDLTYAVPAAFISRYRAIDGVAIASLPGGPSQSFLVLNTRSGPLTNVHLRRAIAYALDYDALRREILKGHAIQIPGYIPPGSAGFDPDEPPPRRNLAAARSELEAAGYRGEPLRLMVSMLGPVAEFIQSNLSAAGINVVIERRQPAAMTSLAQAGRFDLIYSGWTLDSPEATAMLEALLSSRGLANGSNLSGYANGDVDRLLLEAAATPAFVARGQILRRVDAQLRRDRPLIMIFGANPVIAYRADLGGVTLDRYQSYSLPLSRMDRKPAP